MDIKILLSITGLLMTLVFGILRYVIKEKKKLHKNKDDGLYYEDGDDNPYCPNCYVKKRKRILIDKNERKCPKCKTVFERPKVVIEACPKQSPKFRI